MSSIVKCVMHVISEGTSRHWLSASACLVLLGSRPGTPVDERATSRWKSG